jgi:hypothetical protein
MRVTNIKEVEQKVLSGGEPDFTKGNVSLSSALNWYSYYKDNKDSKKYLVSYMTKNNYSKDDISKIQKVSDGMISNVGFVCRLTERGAELEKKNLDWIKSKIAYLIDYHDTKKEEQDLEDAKPKVNIQDRISEQSSEFIGELEGYLDEYESKFNAYEWMIGAGVKSVHARKIMSWFSNKKTEPEIVLSNQCDDDLKEAYSHFSKTDLKKYLTFIQTIVDDAGRIVNNSKITRKPRKTKKPSADKLVSKLQYKKEDVEYKTVSINPSEIIGAKQLWVFNTKTRKLGVYHADSINGLSIKGTSIYGYNANESVQKTLRKPNDVLQAIVKASERKYRSSFGEIKSTEQPLTGRINTDTILLKVFK